MTIKTTTWVVLLTFGSIGASARNSTASQAATTPDPQTVHDAANAAAAGDQSSSRLQSRIQDALRNEPTLSSSHVTVNVTETTIDLAGTVGSGKDKQTAERIAQSFDGNRQMKDNLVVTGHGHSDMAPEHSAMNNGGTGNAPNPAIDPAGNAGSAPPAK
jgi:osmotically-inducible protein OsmY